MKNRYLFLFLFFLAMHLQGQSQQPYAFKVLVNKGNNEYKSGAGWQAIKVGTSLSEKDEIKVGSNAYLGLVHFSGKPLELKESKAYKVAELTKKVSTGTSVLTKYTDFILSNNSGEKNKLAATGAVHRGGKDIPVFLPSKPEQSVFFNSSQIISWDNSDMKGPFVVTFKTLFDDELKRIETSKPSVEVDLSAPEFQNEDNVLVTVVAKGDNKSSAAFTLKRLSKSDRSKVEAVLKDVTATANEETAINKYFVANVFEENKLLIDAATYYQQAIKLDPVYQEYFDQFLLRNALKPLPEK